MLRVLAPVRLFVGVMFWQLYLECSVEGLLEASGLDFQGVGGLWMGFWRSILTLSFVFDDVEDK